MIVRGGTEEHALLTHKARASGIGLRFMRKLYHVLMARLFPAGWLRRVLAAAALCVGVCRAGAAAPEQWPPDRMPPSTDWSVFGSSEPDHGASVHGDIHDTEGRPVPGTRVLLWAGSRPGSRLCGGASTNIDGHFDIFMIPEPNCGVGRFPMTLYAELEPPPGYDEPPAREAVFVASSTNSTRMDWGPREPRVGPRSRVQSELCVSVTLEGRALPHGLFSVQGDTRAWSGEDAMGGGRPRPGSTKRTMLRLQDGRACVEDMRPGNYLLQVSPLSLRWPLELSFAGRAGGAMSYRLSVKEGGEIALFNGQGIPQDLPPAEPLRLEVIEPRPRTARLRGRLIFPPGVSADLDRNPALLVFGFNTTGPLRFTPVWVRGSAFTVDLPEGDLVKVYVGSDGWAIDSTDPDRLWDRSLKLIGGKASRLDIRLTRGAKIGGTVRTPDGKPLRPIFGPYIDPVVGFENRRLLRVESDDLSAYVTEGGTFEFHSVPLGARILEPTGSGRLFPWNVPQPLQVFVDGDKTLDVQLEPHATLTVSPADIPVKPLRGVSANEPLDIPRAYWVIGLPSGTRPSERASALHGGKAPITLRQTSTGAWAPVFAHGNYWFNRDGIFRVSAGAYDFHLLERTSEPLLPALRPLREPETLRIPEASTSTLRMPGPYRRGDCALSGVIRSAESMPRVNLYDGDVWLGTAFGKLKRDRWKFGIEGLSAGAYRAVVSAAGYPDREYKVTLTEGAKTRLDVDLDAKEYTEAHD